MNYKNKRVAITGSTGFLGRALYSALAEAGADIYRINGDIRDPETFAILDHSFDYLFHFADPSSQILFRRQAFYAAETTLIGFMNAAKACQKNGIKLIYPSTGLLSQETENEYARCKKVCEDIHVHSGIDAIAIRIFATYGPGEGHKRDYASVPYLFVRDWMGGHRSVVFGDGNQTRDFIYIDDVIAGIMTIAETYNGQVIDLGSGIANRFNDIFEILKKETGQNFDAIYVDKPGGYVQETLADPSEAAKLGIVPLVTFEQGIKNIIEEFRNGQTT
jgi:UDP-glucose 4-epimerase